MSAASTLPPHMTALDTVLLFDGVCRLCNGWSRFVIRFDRQRRIKLCSVQSAEGQAILAHFGLPLTEFDTLLLVEGPQLRVRSDAVLRVLAIIGWPWRAVGIFRVIPTGLRDWGYSHIARNRYRLFGMLNGGHYDQCLLPSADHAGRFLGDT